MSLDGSLLAGNSASETGSTATASATNDFNDLTLKPPLKQPYDRFGNTIGNILQTLQRIATGRTQLQLRSTIMRLQPTVMQPRLMWRRFTQRHQCTQSRLLSTATMLPHSGYPPGSREWVIERSW